MQFKMTDLSDLTILFLLKDFAKKILKEVSDFEEIKLTEEELEMSALALAMENFGDIASNKEDIQKKAEELYGKEYCKKVMAFGLDLGESIDLTFLEEK